MTMMIRKTLKGDLEAAGFEVYHTFRGITAVDGDRVIGIAGVMYSNPLQCVSWMSEDIRMNRRLVVKGVKMLRDILNECKSTVYTFQDPKEPTAEGFIKHVGFVPTTQDGVHKWQTQ